MNLNDPLALKRIPRSHIVFCRNVIIYFDEAMKKKVINSFYDNLVPGGYLMLGHSESLHKITKAFKPEFHPGTIAYRKE
jgi:chemotaxis protein methyltransferase CheR